MTASDREAQFTTMLEQHRDALYRICCAYVRDDADRKDLYQEVLIQVWKNLSAFRGESKLGTWLYRVAVNVCLSWLRREKRRSEALERASQQSEPGNLMPGPAIASRLLDDVRQLYRCIGHLQPLDRLLVSLHLEEMDHAEIAAVLGITEGNIRVKLHRIKHQLQRVWEKDNHEPR